MNQQLTTTLNKYNWNSIISQSNILGFDTETNGLDLYHPNARVNGFSIAAKRANNEFIGGYFPIAHRRGHNLPEKLWRPILEKAVTKKLVCHNVNFDRRSIELMLGYTANNFFDTTKLSHLNNENYYKARSLDNMLEHYLGRKGKKKTVVFEALLLAYGWDEIGAQEIEEYAETDAIEVLKLFYKIIEKIEKSNEDGVPYYWNKIDMPNFRVLYNMKEKGVGVNLDFCRQMEKVGVEKCEQIKEELGFDPGKPSQLAPVLYDDLGLPVIYAKRKNGESTPTLGKEAMERYENILESSGNPIAKKILEFRGWSKAVSSYYRAYQNHVSYDGRLRPDYLSHGTVTGRYSCKDPNLQQIPKESDKEWSGVVKQCFTARPGYELWEFDYSQLEFRLGAHFSREPKLLEVFNDDTRDIFNEMSSDLGLPRQDCKTQTYSINYGAGAQRIMDVFHLDRNSALQRIYEFYENYPGLRDVNDHVKNIVEKNLKVRIWSGRYRHFQTKSEGFKAFNSFIQGGASDLVKVAMNRINDEIPELRMLLQVHDSIIFEMPTGKVESFSKRIKSIMENPVPEIDWRVHFKVEGERIGS